MITQVAAEVEPVVLAAVEAEVLPRAPGLTVTALRQLVRSELVAHGVVGSDRWRTAAERRADVTVRPTDDGRADLVTSLSVEDAKACWATADQVARQLKADDDTRPLGRLRCLAVRSMILRAGDGPDRPPVSPQLVITAPLDALEPTRSPAAGGAVRTGDPTDTEATRVESGAPVVRRPIGYVGGEASPPATCVSCSNASTRCARAGCGRPPAAR